MDKALPSFTHMPSWSGSARQNFYLYLDSCSVMPLAHLILGASVCMCLLCNNSFSYVVTFNIHPILIGFIKFKLNQLLNCLVPVINMHLMV
jgi:hypothetical protein